MRRTERFDPLSGLVANALENRRRRHDLDRQPSGSTLVAVSAYLAGGVATPDGQRCVDMMAMVQR